MTQMMCDRMYVHQGSQKRCVMCFYRPVRHQPPIVTHCNSPPDDFTMLPTFPRTLPYYN